MGSLKAVNGMESIDAVTQAIDAALKRCAHA
jgi:hypothetical protein